MTATAIIKELTITGCNKWNTDECPNSHTPAMGLAAINWPNLILLNDDIQGKYNMLNVHRSIKNVPCL
jgi:hypothetical protein